MSIYEKIASAAVGTLLLLTVVFSYHEFKEPSEGQALPSASRFDESLGQEFKIGSFDTVISERSSGGQEEGCASLQPVIMGALHDIQRRLDAGDVFEVDENTLRLFCNRSVELTLSDASGTRLMLQKIPFTRAVPQGGVAEDEGTQVRINAFIVPAGLPVPAQPTTYGDLLIPDRFLDAATSSGR